MLSIKTTWIFFSICLLILLFNSNIYAQTIDEDFSLKIKNGVVSVEIDSVEVSEIDNYHRVQVKGLSNFGAPGEPLLPIKTVKYLIPYGKKVADISVGWTSKKFLYGTYLVEPAQALVNTAYEGNVDRTLPNPEIYSLNSAYPAEVFKVVSTQEMRGYKILIINLYPVEYIPASGKLAYYDKLNLNIVLSNEVSTLGSNNTLLYRGIAADKQVVNDFVDNPEDANTYPLNEISSSAAIDYLIITNREFHDYEGANDLDILLAHKQSKGLNTAMVATDDIYLNYSGADNIEKIRACIRAYYTTYGIQYVLLVGDADGGGVASGERELAPIIPVRGLYGIVNGVVSNDPDTNIPCDMYYGCSGEFDFNNNGVYGELGDGEAGGEVDLIADVYIGRAPVDSTTELANFVKKIIAYENSSSDYLKRACMAGRLVDATYAKTYLEEIRIGSSTHGYTTSGMAETGFFSFNNLYEQDGAWTGSQLIDIINAGVHIINHFSHATNTELTAGMSNVNVDNDLINTDYLFGYTSGCYSGAFDNRQSDGAYTTSDSVLEHFTTTANGAFAFIGNSRYGWFSKVDTDGPSQRIQREFWDSVVRDGNVNVGKALQLAKQETIGLVGVSPSARWVYFTTNLLGDPQTPLSAAFLSPTNFSANIIAFANNSWVTLTWKNSSRANLTNIMIRYRTDGTYPTSETDGTLLLSKTAVPGITETYNHTNVSANTTYHYVAFGYDGTDYEGAVATTNRGSVTVLQGSGTSSDDSSGSSNCFVATACYGDQHAPEVMNLRKLRDNHLMHDYRGREFVCFYYIVGPKLAAMISSNDFAKKTVRYWLGPLVKISKILNKGDL